METDHEKSKVEAIYEVRDAAETKVHAEQALEAEPTPEKRDELLDAQMKLEEKTQDAIEVCHECGHEHAPSTPHAAQTIER